MTGSAGAAVADAYTKCVQHQLKALEYDPGAVDGVFGPQTHSAIASLRVGNEQALWLRAMPDLTKTTAVKWCRYLPLLDEDLEKFQPVSIGATILTKSVAGADAQTLVETLLIDVVDFYDRRFGIKFDHQPAVLGGEEPFALSGLFRRELKRRNWPVSYLLNLDVAFVCRVENSTSGLAINDVIALCWDDPRAKYGAKFEKWARFERVNMGAILAHEYMHFIQHKLTTVSTKKSGAPKVFGPSWMTEGTASFIGTEYVLEKRRGIRRTSIKGWQKKLLGTELTLNRLSRIGSIREIQSYHFSSFAVFLLVRRSGEDALFQYWREIGAGANWEVAFEITFGFPLAVFEEKFPKLLTSHQTAREFAKGN